ncbi:MAG: hypothetical protein ACRD1U_02920, partial [Vicinamibacterales bacterium]
VQGVCLAESGQAGEALAQLRDSLAVQDRMHAGLLRPTFLTLLAQVLLRAGRTREGLEEIANAFEWAERTGEHYYRAETRRTCGELLLAAGERAEADAALDEAARLAAAQGALSIELRVAISRARLLREAGRVPDAHAVLHAQYSRFDEGFETGDLREARTLLQELAGC